MDTYFCLFQVGTQRLNLINFIDSNTQKLHLDFTSLMGYKSIYYKVYILCIRILYYLRRISYSHSIFMDNVEVNFF